MSQPNVESTPPRTAAGWEPIVGAIGPKVREIRQQLGLSLQQLAVRADVSAAAIHKVERGDMVPTITTLLKLAAALGRPIGYFVDDTDQAAPIAVHVTAEEQPAPPSEWSPAASGVEAFGFTVADDRPRACAVHATIAPGGSSGDIRPLGRGEELLLVLDGTLVVEVAGERYQVRSGDTLHYPIDRPHNWRNPGPGPVRAIWYLLHG